MSALEEWLTVEDERVCFGDFLGLNCVVSGAGSINAAFRVFFDENKSQNEMTLWVRGGSNGRGGA